MKHIKPEKEKNFKITPGDTELIFETEYIYDDVDNTAAPEVFSEAPEGPFLESLRLLTADDCALPPPKEPLTFGRLASLASRYILIIICVCAFAGSFLMLIKTAVDNRRSSELYSELAQTLQFSDISAYGGGKSAVELSPMLKRSPATPDNKTSTEAQHMSALETAPAGGYNERFENVKAKLNALKNTCPDLYGWITVSDTNIDYPIMQSGDNDFYLNHAYTGVALPAGSVFADFRCGANPENNHNTVLYGHNMTNGSMFNHVTKYLKQSFFDEHPYIELYTLDGIFTYEVFSIYQTKYNYKYIDTDFANEESFIAFAEEMRSNSLFERKDMGPFTEVDSILTLSTCTNGFWTGRYALQAKLISVIK